jgi:hypothetical protein
MSQTKVMGGIGSCTATFRLALEAQLMENPLYSFSICSLLSDLQKRTT